MSKSNIDKQVYEQYVDATVALFMEHYAAALADATIQTETAAPSCSEMLEHRCMKVIRKECAKRRTRALWKGTKKVLSSAAIVLVALLSLSSILFMTVEAFRVPVINFFIEQGDGFWAITGKSNDDPIDPATTDEFDPNDPLAGLLPEEYSLVDVKQNKGGATISTYRNLNGDKIFLWFRPNTSHITVDSEDALISKKGDVAGCESIFVMKDDFAQLAWVSTAENTSYLLNANTMDEETLMMIAENIMKKQ